MLPLSGDNRVAGGGRVKSLKLPEHLISDWFFSWGDGHCSSPSLKSPGCSDQGQLKHRALSEEKAEPPEWEGVHAASQEHSHGG